MSNTSDQTTQPSKTRLIIDEVGVDTETGIIGRGHSYDNGKTFTVDKTIYGRIFHKSDHDQIWKGIQDKVDKVVAPAKSAADSAVAYANDAVKNSQVNSQAIEDINSAVSDATSAAAVARSDGLRAWNAAQSNVNLIDLNYASASASISSARTEAIAAADEAKASASAAQADIVAVRSDVAAVQADVTATRSDVAVAKSDIADTKTSLTSQAKGLSSYAAQASAAGKDITTLKSQAGQFEQDMASTKGDVSQLKVSASAASVALSDAAGNISSLQATAKSYSAALSDTNSNVASVTATARELETKYADAAGDINKLQTDAKGTTQTLADAQGDIAKLKTRADGFDTEFATANGNISKLQTDASGTKQTMTNAKSDIAVLQSRADGLDAKYADAAGDINTLKANASGFSQTLVDAKGDISTLQSTATGLKNTLTDAQGNISTLQSDVSGLKKTTSDNAGNIATLQADAKTLISQMSSAQGNISTLQQTASGFSSKVSGMETSLADANSKINDITSNGGGRNYLRDSDKSISGWVQDLGTIPNEVLNSLAGETITVSVDVEWSNFQHSDSLQNRLGFELACSGSDGKSYWWGAWKSPSTPSGKERVSTTFTLPANVTFTVNNNGLNGYVSINGTGRVSHAQVENGTVAHDWSPAPEDTDAKITTNTTAIEQNKKAITLKADQATVDKANGTVQKLQSQLKVQAGQIASKVSSSDLDAKGYATQTYTQTQIKQTSDSWNANLTSVKNGLTKSYTNLHATVDGVQAQVYNSDGSSKITQLSNLIATKVSQDDYNSQITQLKNDINLRVSKGDVISQINLQAGTALIQSNKIVLDAGTTIVTGKEFIPSAAIAELDADKLTFYGNGAKASIGASVAQYDDDKTKSTINLQYDGGIEIHSSSQQGSILTMHDNTIRLASKSWGDNSNPYQYSGFYAAPNYSLMNTYHKDGTTSGVAIDDNRIWIYGDSKDQQLGALQADVGWYSINGKTGLLTGNQITLKSGNTQAVLTDKNINIENTNNTNSKNYDVGIHIKGWAEITGWFNCMGLSQTSLLSAKTRIEPLDTKVALDKIASTNVETYQFKSDVANGKTKRHASVIIDDVHDVAEYYTPEEFISENRMGRDDGDIIGYLMGAVQELKKQLDELKEKI